jgi:ribonuclease D
LRYAALDVELLVELRDVLVDRLAAAGKAQWAAEEFAHELHHVPPPPRPDPWRRVTGAQALRDRRKLAVVRALWQARDDAARHRDIAVGRVLPDQAIVAAADALPRTAGQLQRLAPFSGRGQRRRSAAWQHAIDTALALRDDELPPLRGERTPGPPQPRMWPERDPAAARRQAAARAGVATASLAHTVPPENLLQPDTLRRLCWTPPTPATAATVGEALRERGARPWQIELLAADLAAAIAGAA